MLAAARRPYERLMLTRAIHDWQEEVDWLLAELERVGAPIEPDALLGLSEVAGTTHQLAKSSTLAAGFLQRDPRTPRLVADAQAILEDQISAYWRGLTDPRTLAERLVRQKVEGVPYIEAARQISREYGAEFYRSERLVRSAYNTASNHANLQAIEAAGFEHKRWLTSRDSRVRHPTGSSPYDHRAAEGQTVPIDQPFLVSGEELMFPGDASRGASIGNIIQCRCTCIGSDKPGRTFQVPNPEKKPASPTAPAAPAADKPTGTTPTPSTPPAASTAPVSAALIPLGPRAKLAPVVQEVLATIDAVHTDGQLPTIPITSYSRGAGTSGNVSAGGYRATVDAQTGQLTGSLSIDLNSHERAARAVRNTLTHEIGHFLDHRAFGAGDDLATRAGDPAFAEWRRAVDATNHIAQLKDAARTGTITANGVTYRGLGVGYFKYLLEPHEVWARSYAQYVAEVSGNPGMLAEIAGERGNRRYPSQWTESDFAPVRAAIENLFRRKGWRP